MKRIHTLWIWLMMIYVSILRSKQQTDFSWNILRNFLLESNWVFDWWYRLSDVIFFKYTLTKERFCRRISALRLRFWGIYYWNMQSINKYMYKKLILQFFGYWNICGLHDYGIRTFFESNFNTIWNQPCVLRQYSLLQKIHLFFQSPIVILCHLELI